MTHNIYIITIVLLTLVAVWYSVKKYIANQLQKEAIHDPQSILFNQKYLIMQLQSASSISRRYRSHLSLLRISMDGYSHKTYKKKTGDILMRRLGEILSSTTRDSDIAARYDDNNFIILLPFTDKEQAKALEKRLKETLLSYHFNVEPKVQFSFSSIEYDREESIETLIQRVLKAY